MTGHEHTPEAPLVRLCGASVSRGGARLLADLDFRLDAGARWAVLGQNGAGKTTFLRLLRGDITPDQPAARPDAGLGGERGEQAVRIYCLPDPASAEGGAPQTSPLGLRQRLAVVSADMQDLYARNEWAATGLEAVLSGFYDTALLYATPTKDERAQALATLELLGLTHLAGQRVARLSTGQARSLLLARALACKPAALFLDECLEGLDAQARAAFLAVLDRACEAEPRLAMLFCSHRTDELPASVTQALVLQAGRIVACGPLGDIAARLDQERPASHRTEGMATATPGDMPGDAAGRYAPELPEGLTAGRPGHALDGTAEASELSTPATLPGWQAQAQASGQPFVPLAAQAAAPDVPLAPPASSAFLVHISGADVVLDGATLLSGIDWTLRPGEHWAVLGQNGAGKTTLLNLLAGELWPSALSGPPGRVEYGFALPGHTLDETRRRIGRVGAALDRDYGWNLRVDETVWSGAFGSIGLYAEAGPELRARAAQLLEFFGLSRLAGRSIQSLSRGQLRRVMFARALLGHGGNGPALLLLDEPMAGLDTRARRDARELLARMAQAGTPLVMVTHHLRDLPEQVNRVLRLKAGRVEFCGEREAYEAWRAVHSGRTARPGKG